MGKPIRRQPRWRLWLRQFARWLLVRFFRVVARAWRASWRFETIKAPGVEAAFADGPVLFAHWHCAVVGVINLRREKLYTLVSQSRDGEMARQIIRFAVTDCVSGSAGHGGMSAMRQLIRHAQDGADLAIALDGPLGPAYEVKPGALRIAQRAGIPIIPFHYASRRGVRLNTWDGLWFPWPFTRFRVEYGAPIVIKSDCSDDEMKGKTAHLQEQLRTMYEAGEIWAGRPADRSRYGNRKRKKERKTKPLPPQQGQ